MTAPGGRRNVAALSQEKRLQLERLLIARSSSVAPIPRREPGAPAPLSPPQRRLWFLDQLAPGSPTYNAVVAVRARGPLDLHVLHRVLHRIVERHEVLRSGIRDVNGVAVQRPLEEWTLVFDVIAAEEVDGSLETAVGRLREFARRPYDLARDVTLRVQIVALADGDHLLGFAEHHIAFDGWSDEVLFAELSDGYAAETAGRVWQPADLEVQYADVAAWLDTRPTDPALIEYWRGQLAGAPAAIRLPVDHDHPAVPRYSGRHVPIQIPDVLDELSALRSEETATAFVVLTAALAAAVFRWSGEPDIVVGSPFANRGRAELEPLIGFFSNTVPLRLRMSAGASFRSLVRQAREVIIGAFEHQELPFERIVELTGAPRDQRRNPLFQVNLRVQQGTPPMPSFPGVTTEPVAVDLGFSRFDLAMDLSVSSTGIVGYVEYNEDLFDDATIARLVAWCEVFVADCLRRPDEKLGALEFGTATGSVRGRRRRAPVTG